eukprot:SAG11_NODE_173_length_13507_cov_10.489931_12_plen_610_part_00
MTVRAEALAQALAGEGDHEEAVEEFQAALSNFRRSSSTSLPEALRGKAGQDWSRELRIQQAKSEFAMNERNAENANVLIREVLGEDENSKGALLFYGSVMIERRNWDEALTTYLRLVVISMGEDPQLKPGLARLLATPQVLADLKKRLPPTAGASTGDIYGYLAGVCKDRSEMETAIGLYHDSIEIGPNPNYLLNLMHTHEIVAQWGNGVLEAVTWLKKHAANVYCKEKNAEGELEPRVTAKAVLDVLQAHMEAHPDCLASRAGWTPGEALFVPEGADGIDPVHPDEKDGGGRRLIVSLKGEKLTRADLDFLAVVFTIIKVCFVTGQLEVLVPLIHTVEQEHSDRMLHETNIKNEAAYFGCIKQIVGLWAISRGPGQPIAAASSGTPPIYVIGDSHALAMGWQTLTDPDGRERLLVPRVVTGMKCWHLRDNEEFYPKLNFEKVTATLPQGADVIFAFGEIDCREGILVAVERLKYRDVAHGIHVAQDIYCQRLRALQRKKNLNIYIHPVPPVMDVTRKVVRQWNEALKAKLAKENASARNGAELRWLDFYESLLSPEDGTFLKTFALDTIHMNPAYVPALLQPAYVAARIGDDPIPESATEVGTADVDD